MKYYYWLLILFLAILIGSAFYIYTKQNNQSNLKPPTTIAPTNKESCLATGGRWGRIGLSLNEVCNLPTFDAGKQCSNSNDCEGSCLAELSKEDWDKAAKGIVYTKGKCTAWKITVGCQAFVENGKVEGILCVD